MFFRRQARFRSLRLSNLVPITEPTLLASVIGEKRDAYHGKHQRDDCQRNPHLIHAPFSHSLDALEGGFGIALELRDRKA